MKIHKELFDRQWVRITLSLCAAILFYVCLSHINLLFTAIGQIWKVTYPVFIGLIIAYILNPLVKLIRRSLLRGMKRPKAAWGASVAVTVVVVLPSQAARASVRTSSASISAIVFFMGCPPELD